MQRNGCSKSVGAMLDGTLRHDEVVHSRSVVQQSTESRGFCCEGTRE